MYRTLYTAQVTAVPPRLYASRLLHFAENELLPKSVEQSAWGQRSPHYGWVDDYQPEQRGACCSCFDSKSAR